MRRQGLLLGLLVAFAIAAIPLLLHAAGQELKFAVPSESGKSKFFQTIKAGLQTVLNVTVLADDGFTMRKNELSSKPAEITHAGQHQLTVPAAMAEGTYGFGFKGTVVPNGGGAGNGGEPAEIPWAASARVAVNECTAERSGSDALDPPGQAKLTSRDTGLQKYEVNVPIANHSMGDVSNALHEPEGGSFMTEWKWVDEEEGNNVANPVCTECGEQTIRYEVWYAKYEIRFDYYIVMPEWLQEQQAGNRAQAAWQAYYKALLAHEKGHEQVLKDWEANAGKALFDQLVATRYFGEAHNADRAMELAREPWRNAAVPDIWAAYTAMQLAYENVTGHGKTQSEVGGVDIPIINPAIECSE